MASRPLSIKFVKAKENEAGVISWKGLSVLKTWDGQKLALASFRRFSFLDQQQSVQRRRWQGKRCLSVWRALILHKELLKNLYAFFMGRRICSLSGASHGNC